MYWVKLIISLSFIFTFADSFSAKKLRQKPIPSKSSQILSYQQWKEMQINLAQNKIIKVYNQLQILKTSPQKKLINKSLIQKNLQSQLSSAQSYLNFSLSLSFDDYLSIYISQLPARKIKDAARKMTKSEVTILLTSYLKQFQQKKTFSSKK